MKTLSVKTIAEFFSQFGELFRWDQYSGNPDFSFIYVLGLMVTMILL